MTPAIVIAMPMTAPLAGSASGHHAPARVRDHSPITATDLDTMAL